MRTENLTENEIQLYKELDESKAKIELLETAVKSMQEALEKLKQFVGYKE